MSVSWTETSSVQQMFDMPIFSFPSCIIEDSVFCDMSPRHWVLPNDAEICHRYLVGYLDGYSGGRLVVKVGDYGFIYSDGRCIRWWLACGLNSMAKWLICLGRRLTIRLLWEHMTFVDSFTCNGLFPKVPRNNDIPIRTKHQDRAGEMSTSH